LPNLFEAFDFPDPSMVGGRRNVSTVAPQALFFMNSELILLQSEFAASQLLTRGGSSDEARIDAAFRQLLGRLPSSAERTQALRFVVRLPTDSDKQARQRWSQFLQALFGTLDFRYVH
jgi:hypothetical protein